LAGRGQGARVHRHPVGDLENLDQVVRDEYDRAAAVGETAREIEHLAGLGHGECCGRLVHDDETRIEVERASDRDSLALAAGKAADRRIGVGDMGVQLLQQRGDARLHLGAAQERHAGDADDEFAPEKDIVRDR
jgi:hypothetical protein